jgi:PAS domain S-box-containing protein
MIVTDLLSVLTRLGFLLLAALTLADLIRHRDRARLDVALVFVSLSANSILQPVLRFFGLSLPWLNIVGTMALVAQPYLLLRIAGYFQTIPPFIRRVALAGLLAIWLPIIFLSPLPTPAVLAIVIYFVLVEGYATWVFLRGGMTSTGLVRWRLRLASLGSALVGLVILLAGVMIALPSLRDLIAPQLQVLAILAAIAYYLGFAPPRWLRQFWQLLELQNFLRTVARLPAAGRVMLTLGLLCPAATRVTGVGVVTTAVFLRDEAGQALKLRSADRPAVNDQLIVLHDGLLLRACRERLPLIAHNFADMSTDERSIAEPLGASALLAVPIVSAQRDWGVLAVFLAHRPLFPGDDLGLLALLAEQAASALESEELERQVRESTATLAEANTLLQTMLDHVPDHVFFKDKHSRFIRNSRSQASMLGLSDPALAVGKTDFDFFPHAQRSFDEEQTIMRSGQPLIDFEEHVVWPDGRETWVSTTKVPLTDQDGQIIGTFGIARDITDRKQAEEKLRKAKDELEAFSYSVSHDLRAPLRGIDGWSQALLEDYGNQLDEQGRTYIERVRSETQRMGVLIDDMLQLSRLTRVEMHQEQVNLSAIAQNIADHLQESEPQRQVKFEIQKGLSAKGDAHLLEAALTNLLSNSFKFTGKTPQAHIEFGQLEIENKRTFFVRDNGAGFDMAFAKKLFGAFQRMHKASEFPGTGVGLATVQRIIGRHGGRVWAESAVNEGATFYFTLEEGS